MKDRLGNDLHIGDVCVCYNNMGTGSSTNRLVQYEGEIIGFTQNFVKMKCLKCGYSEKTGGKQTELSGNHYGRKSKSVVYIRHIE